MTINVTLNKKVYTYKDIGGYKAWVDSDNNIVPLFLHSKLREKAVESGTDISNFISTDVVKLETPKPKTSEVKTSKKAKLIGFNPLE